MILAPKLRVFLEKMKRINGHRYLDDFHPEKVLYSEEYKEYIEQFDAGSDNLSFNEFLYREAGDYSNNGDGTTYLVFNHLSNADKELVAYFTLCSSAIPYTDRWKLPAYESEEIGIEYDEKICGIPAIEIKMFAVSEKYQDVFFRYENEEKPIAAWILSDIIHMILCMKETLIGIKAVYLRSVPSAEEFYQRCGFDYILKPMNPFYCIDDEFKAMFIPFVKIDIHYDE